MSLIILYCTFSMNGHKISAEMDSNIPTLVSKIAFKAFQRKRIDPPLNHSFNSCMSFSVLSPGGHTYTCIILHEPEAPAAIHQKSHEEVPGGDRSHRERPRSDSQGRVREHEPDGLRPECGHSGHARCKIRDKLR